MHQAAEERRQTRTQAFSFAGKALILQSMRGVSNWLIQPRRFQASRAGSDLDVLARSASPLFTSENPAELRLQAGKVQNLRVAARYLDGVRVPANEIFSFWAHLPRPTRTRGFVPGRELREGCIIPNIGGGLCQLSNALYDCALQAGLDIVERHAHSRIIPGSLAEQGRDATIFWNYVDLRFRGEQPFRIGVRLTERELIVEFRGQRAAPAAAKAAPRQEKSRAAEVESCETCGMRSCFRHIGGPGAQELTAWLLDAWWPEFDEYLRKKSSANDWLFLPLDGERFHVRNYRWSTAAFAKVAQAPMEVLMRSLVSRRLAAQGAKRQRALLRFDQRLAENYARRLPPLARHLVVSQNLLPFLWRTGVLGGRTFDVLMTRLPIAELQASLDRAAALYPGSGTIADFRADARLVEEESAALQAARRWITPHSEIAGLNAAQTTKLEWNSPVGALRSPGSADVIYFPASTLARKGAYEVREVARQLGLRVALGGPSLESPDFWQGIPLAPMEEASLVVLPAWVEHQPRRLLAAASAGTRVLASYACGLQGVANVTSVPAGSVEALVEGIRNAVSSLA